MLTTPFLCVENIGVQITLSLYLIKLTKTLHLPIKYSIDKDL